MRLMSLFVENYCQHEARTVDFAPGMTLITGPNGSGKSNLLSGIIAALTGDSRHSAGVKSSCVRHGAPKSAKSQVRLVFEHAGRIATATCGFRPGSRSFVVEGEKEVTKDSPVRDAIEAFLGTTSDILSNYVLVGQHDLFSVFNQTPSKRTQMLHGLFGLDKAGDIWNELGAAIQLLPTYMPVDVPARREALRLAEIAVVECQSAIPAASQEQLRERVRFCETVVRDVQQQSELEARHAQAVQELSSVEAELQNFAAEQAIRLSSRDVATGQAARCPAILAYAATKRRAMTLEDDIRRKQHQLSGLPSVPAPVGYLPPAERQVVQQQLDSLRVSYESAVSIVNSVGISADISKAVCSKCGQSLAPVQHVVTKARADVAAIGPMLSKALDAVKQSEQWDRSVLHIQAQRQAITADIERLTSELSALSFSPPEGVPESADDAEKLAASITEGLTRINTEFEIIAQTVMKLNARHRSLKEQVDQLSAQRASQISRNVSMTQALADLASANNELQQAMTAAFALRSAVSARDAAVAALAEAEETLAETRRIAEKRDVLQSLRTLYHRDAMPKVMASDMMRRLVYVTNEFLTEFGPPFHLDVDSEGEFVVQFPAGKMQPPGRLSGGERVILALAFRLAVHATFAAQIKLICLDEPTVGLDEYNLDCLGRAFQRLGVISRSAGLQVVVVTHEQSIAHLFDHQIRL
jgi:exonuclease SbcC